MATVWAIKTGNWSDPTVWSSGTVPGTTDDVYLNGYPVNINQNIQVASVRATATSGVIAGGYGALAAGTYTIQCDMYASSAASSYCFRGNSLASGNYTFVGNCYGGISGSSYCIYFLGCSNVTFSFTGNSNGGSVQSSHGIFFSACTNMNISYSGTLTGGGLGAAGMSIGGTAITANLTATANGSITGQAAIANSGPGLSIACVNSTINFNGNSTGGASYCCGIWLSATSQTGTVVTINGIATGGTGGFSYGVYNGSINGTVRVYSAVSSTVAEGVAGTANGTTTVERMTYSLGGVSPITGNVKIRKTTNTQFSFYDDTNTLNVFYDPTQTANVVPNASDVRQGVSYLGGTRVGSCVIASPSNVRIGVATDNTVGTAALTPADIVTAVQAAFPRMPNVATVDSTAQQLIAALSTS
ncbi:hypothetical protein [Spirosoma aerolatum]|uniref:hypothetical protein n=1 Tax=Spirosoma aerolatum TaxID=1211326 RepID=UPI0009AD1D6C|nr:hypothetical protein [Spirosoma aerolatum]